MLTNLQPLSPFPSYNQAAPSSEAYCRQERFRCARSQCALLLTLTYTHLSLPTVLLTANVLQVSSSGHALMIPKTMRFDTPSDLTYHGTSSKSPYATTWDLFSRYALSKLANILFTSALQQRHPSIVCTSCNPGGTNTAGGMSVWPPLLHPIMSRLFAPPAVGARPVLLLAAGSDVAADREKFRGVYMGSTCKVEMPSLLARNKEMAENLWKVSEEALNKWIKG